MDSFTDIFQQAFALVVSGDTALWTIIWVSVKVSLTALLIATPLALIIAFILAFTRFIGRRLIISSFNVLLAFPSVVVGLIVYLLLARHGLLGDLQLLFTQSAMVIGQVFLCIPILVAMGHAALQAADRRAWETAITLGAPPWRAMLTLMYEVRFALIATVIAGFSRIISEVGSAMMVGGNILGYTRNITTAIALETSKGEFAQGVALGIILLAIALLLNLCLVFFQGRGQIHS